MPTYQRYQLRRIPEVLINNGQQVAANLRELQRLGLPAFVMRAANVSHQKGMPPRAPLSGGSIALGACVSVYNRSVGDAAHNDFGFHWDGHSFDPSSEPPLVNLHTTTRGRALARLLVPQPGSDLPAVMDTFASQTTAGDMARRMLGNGFVDLEAFHPVCHYTALEPGDSLAFLDWHTLHEFISLETPRSYSSGLYPIEAGTDGGQA